VSDRIDARLLEFPCEFPIKVIGPANEDFDLTVAAIFRRHVPDMKEGAVKQRVSRTGKYLSLTITIDAQSQYQLDGIYRELSAHQGVLMVL
jgi:putative lipoic acid-binding regulatory protein